MTIVTTALLLSLEPIVIAEAMIPRDPREGWFPPFHGEPHFDNVPVHSLRVLLIDGRVERHLLDDAPDWREVAAYRFEDRLGNPIPGDDEEDDPYWPGHLDEDDPPGSAGDGPHEVGMTAPVHT